MTHHVYTTETFDREFKKKHGDKNNLLESIIAKLERLPQQGKPLRGRLHGIWQLRVGPFRVWYEINEAKKHVILRAILHKDDAKARY